MPKPECRINDEIRMSNECRMTKHERNDRRTHTIFVICHSSFGIHSTFWFRHSGIGIQSSFWFRHSGVGIHSPFWLRHSSLACVALTLLTLPACSSGGPEPTYPVSGTVTVGGKPLEGGSILFEPAEPGPSGNVHSARGTIDDAGGYQLSTFGVGDGAVAGKHHIMVFEKEKQLSDDPNLVRTSIIPDKYHMPETSPLVRDVEAKENVIDLEIEKSE
jgi:hypothetical protein